MRKRDVPGHSDKLSYQRPDHEHDSDEAKDVVERPSRFWDLHDGGEVGDRVS